MGDDHDHDHDGEGERDGDRDHHGDDAAAAAASSRGNWREAPQRRWAFRNVAAIFPTAPIAPAAAAAVRPLPRVPAGAAPPLPDGALHGGAVDVLRATATDALVVLHDGRVLSDYYAPGHAAGAAHICMSVTKAALGLLAGALVRRGELDLEAPAARYVPEVRRSGLADASVRQLLDMRAGVRPGPAWLQAYDAALAGAAAAPGLRALLAALPAAAVPHGGPFAYVPANTDLVGWALERAGGAPLATLLQRRLWQPVGAAHPASLLLDDAGAPWCSGGLSATAEDLARLGLAVLGGGRGGAAAVPAAWAADLAAGGDRAAWRDGAWGRAFAGIGRTMSYRSGWYAVHDAPPLLFGMGTYGQNLFVDPGSRLVVAKFSSQQRVDGRAVARTHRALDALRQAVVGGPEGAP